jgi:hypothetical protein
MTGTITKERAGDPTGQPASVVAGGHYSFVSQFLTLSLPGAVLERLDGHQDYDDLDDALLYSRLNHERTHYLQNVTTTYGLWKTFALRTAASCAYQSMRAYRKISGPITPPFEDWLPRYGAKVQAGLEQAAEAGVYGRWAFGWLQLMEDCTKYDPRCPLFPGVRAPVGATNPHWEDGDRLFPRTGAKELLEFQARASEVSCLCNTRGITAEHRASIIPTVWADGPSQRALRMCERAFGSKTSESILACYSVIDVALNPCWRCGSFDEPVPWEEVHPGWRFVTLLDLIRSKGLDVPAIDKREEFKSLLCRELGWPTPKRSLESFIAFAEESELWQTCTDVLHLAKLALGSMGNEQTQVDAVKLLLPYDFQTFRALAFALRGPLPRGTELINVHAALLDIALQIFMGTEVVCPFCIGYAHQEECLGAALVAELV